MVHAISLALVLFALWLLLSGHYVPLLIGLGALSVLLVVTIALRMDVVDREGHPIHLSPKALLYWPWLAWEIVKSNLDVARRILSPTLPISPTVIRLKASQKSDLGRVIYANSITLTPGTVSIDIDGEHIEVHALTREAAQALRTGDMDRRVTRFEGDE
ncbi:MAG: Na+/H+ antiporter subunit E [Gammaproteobacteria bacterium]|nr:Na+/H+ antiporter subunit E [Gammaproteobacteria bacterium]